MRLDPPALGLSTDALLAAALVAINPSGLGGVCLRASAGPEREAWHARLRALLPSAAPKRRLPLNIADDRLLGGLDLTATLQAGRPVVQHGLLAESDGGLVTLAMAERCPPALAAKLAMVMDGGAVTLERDGLTDRHLTRFTLVLLDEGIEDDERPPPCLLDRLAFHISLDLPIGEDEAILLSDLDTIARSDMVTAQRRLPAVETETAAVEALGATTLALGIASARALSFACAAARTSAALFGRTRVSEEDARLAARLVLAPRATCVPAPEEAQDRPEPEPPAQPPPEDSQDGNGKDRLPDTLENVVVAATKAAIPPDLLAKLATGGLRRAQNAGSGRARHLQAISLRGRPAGTRRGAPKPGQRLNVLETLRAAAPWQGVRQRDRAAAQRETSARLEIRRDDFRVTRHKHHPQTTTIFVVDASGSTALHRLAEAKGAVELLLADCYIRRDHVALLAFSGEKAELLLPPTRSLTRVKRSLAGFPAGGGTPLASAIDAAAALAEGIRRRAGTPSIVFLTDGRGNITREGKADREQADRDARAAARALAAGGLASLLIDISQRPRPAGRELAAEMRAHYLALPHADAATLSGAVQAYARAEGG